MKVGAGARDLTIVAEMKTICDEFEAYGYRRVDAELRHRGIVKRQEDPPAHTYLATSTAVAEAK
jgi:hypothetical protein